MLVLIADDLPDVCNEILQNAGVEVLKKTGLKPPELDAVIKMCDGVIVRSNTKLTAPVLEKSEKLKAICRAGVGVDNIDVPAATKKGIVVMNTPAGNIISTAEHTIALLCSLSRFVPQACASVKEGKWEKKKFTGQQLTGKTFGIIGLGRVGRQVAKRAAALEMKVIGYDPFITTEISSQYNIHIVKNLRDLLAQADYITIHVTLNKETKNLITSKEFSLMKKGVQIINCARGGVICEEDLYNAIKTGQVAGAALDVFEEEPPKDNKLLQLEEVIATPHLGASTEEAQYAVAIEAAEQMAAALTGKGYKNAVNLSPYSPEEYASLKSYLALAEKMGSFLTQINNAGIQTLDIVYTGEISHKNIRIVTDSLIVGLLKPSLEEGVNLVSAPTLLAERGIKVNVTTSSNACDFSSLVAAKITTSNGETCISGTVFGKNEPRLVDINGYGVEAILNEQILVLFGRDKPGFIGQVGSLLGNKNINIAHMTFGRKEVGGNTISILNIDAVPPQDCLNEIKQLNHIDAAFLVQL
ncbi:D-3-phosphoglycerate dehydrogenase [Candidatus Kuenenia stuttgartiensis]|jgi:D-3-phosphoglycerate dehydrogenase|nr:MULTISPECIES: phosphoglycerate dehydrogenase [Kuenenia]MBZ0191289.1 phosphoglycerate dehydrogenase [Candidatus Kuenenia stuttgartiensis]MCL4726006.1 phosphoglycerate dehydrogenase [Candidatus Kuenenia stuttgartiensis]MCZ7621757.1 phosphoglycerate dehydrogenase [Candidatus Kuenenia sp.]QII09989.1 D-3-phosphoglycerate dehydrogenase [Candidatus Kuenenia stuttgartiensis]TVM02058.1 MAG: phosphoglycerate dehydrogenase [Candidatus Kuenenia stuttgartiensis]